MNKTCKLCGSTNTHIVGMMFDGKGGCKTTVRCLNCKKTTEQDEKRVNR